MLKKEKYNIITVGIVSALMMLIIMLPSMLQNHGIFIIRGDYVDQYIPRLIKAREIITSGKGTWDWFNYLGAPYNSISMLFSLNSVCLLFPSNLIPYAVTYMHLIRFALIAMTVYAYFSVMVKEKKTAFLGSILYTFSSYTFLNFEFMQFMEALWTFPLILLSAEKLFRTENYKHQLIFSVFLSCTINFYFFVFSTLSFSVYFLCRFFLSDEWRKKRNLKYFLLAVLEYVIGFLCAFVVFAPFIYSLFNSAGSTDSISTKLGIGLFIYDNNFLSKIAAFLMPAASNRFNTFGYSSWLSHAYYIPIFGISYVISYVLNNKKKNWLTILIFTLLLCVLIPGIGMVYNMFSSNYTRYAYGLVLFFVLATIMFLEQYNSKAAKKGIIIVLTVLGGFIVGYYFAKQVFSKIPFISSILYMQTQENHIETHFRTFRIISSVIFYAILVLFYKIKYMNKNILIISTLSIVIYGCAYTQINLSSANMIGSYPNTSLTLQRQSEIYFGQRLPLLDESAYRIDYPKHCINYSYTALQPSISIFESVRNPYTNQAATYLNSEDGRVRIAPNDDINSLRTLLGVKYYLDIYPKDGLPVPADFTYKFEENDIKVYENTRFVGMGFSYENYMLRSEFEKIAETTDNCSDIMLNTLIIEDKDIGFVSEILTPYTENNSVKNRIVFDKFEYNSNGFTGTINTPRESIIYVSVPYEKAGWKAKINGKETEFINANIGFIAFKTMPGENIVTFTYTSPSLKGGAYISTLGFLLLVIYLFLYKKKIKTNLMKGC